MTDSLPRNMFNIDLQMRCKSYSIFPHEKFLYLEGEGARCEEQLCVSYSLSYLSYSHILVVHPVIHKLRSKIKTLITFPRIFLTGI